MTASRSGTVRDDAGDPGRGSIPPPRWARREGGGDTGSPCTRAGRWPCAVCHNRRMRLLRMKPGHGEVLIAEGDVDIAEQEHELIAAFRAQLDAGMWAAVPVIAPDGRRQAELVRRFEDVPRDAERVIFFPRAAGGC
jgi:hypothetical protein